MKSKTCNRRLKLLGLSAAFGLAFALLSYVLVPGLPQWARLALLLGPFGFGLGMVGLDAYVAHASRRSFAKWERELRDAAPFNSPEQAQQFENLARRAECLLSLERSKGGNESSDGVVTVLVDVGAKNLSPAGLAAVARALAASDSSQLAHRLPVLQERSPELAEALRAAQLEREQTERRAH